MAHNAASTDHATEAERAEVNAFRQRAGLAHLVDVHTHVMPDRRLAKVWAYFEQAGPLVGGGWSIAYRHQEQQRLEILRGVGVRAFTSMVYPHKPDRPPLAMVRRPRSCRRPHRPGG